MEILDEAVREIELPNKYPFLSKLYMVVFGTVGTLLGGTMLITWWMNVVVESENLTTKISTACLIVGIGGLGLLILFFQILRYFGRHRLIMGRVKIIYVRQIFGVTLRKEYDVENLVTIQLRKSRPATLANPNWKAGEIQFIYPNDVTKWIDVPLEGPEANAIMYTYEQIRK